MVLCKNNSKSTDPPNERRTKLLLNSKIQSLNYPKKKS